MRFAFLGKKKGQVRIAIHFKRHLNREARCMLFLYQPCNQYDT